MPIYQCLFLILNLMSLVDSLLYLKGNIQKGEVFFIYFALSDLSGMGYGVGCVCVCVKP